MYFNLTINFITCFLFLTLVSSTFSQNIETKLLNPETKMDSKFSKKNASLKWMSLADELTDRLLKDAGNLSRSEEPVLLARLSGLWWKTDNVRARKWLKAAVDEVTSDSLVETDDEKSKRLETAKKLIKFVVPLDNQLSEILIEKISKESSENNSRQQNADELIKAALQIVEQNPKLAKNLGSLSLKNGQSYLIFRLIGELNLKDSSLGESLFNEAILVAKSSINTEKNLGFVSALSSATINSYKGKAFSDTLKKQFLATLFEIISVPDVSLNSQKATCKYTPIAIQLISLYQTYFPEHTAFILQKSNSCNPTSSSNSTETDTNLNTPNTVDEYIKAAKESKNKALKEKYFTAAIEKLYQGKDYERAISILKEMTEDERTVFGQEAWESWWWECAIEASVKYIKEKDFASTYRIINDTPRSIRPIVQLGIAKKFKEDKVAALSLLNDARKGVNSSDMLPKDKAELYLSLVPQYIDIAPYETGSVFREAISVINNSDDYNSDDKPEKNYLPLKEVISLPIWLFEDDEISSMDTLSKIKKLNNRVRFSLGFLEQALKKFNEAKLTEKQADRKNQQQIK